MKDKLNIEKQIEDLKVKGVKFDVMSEEEAKRFLRYNNFYFKLKSYAKNYLTYQKTELRGQYINLDFAYLVELSKLDMYLRKLIVHMCLDIEHFLKTRLMYDLSINDEEDGYNIVKKYLDGHYDILSNLYQNLNKSATSGLIEKFKENEEDIPIWSFIETLSFGRFIELYDLYYGTYGGKNYSSYLGAIKFLRNAAAHNTCLLNSIRKPYPNKIHKTRDIMDVLKKVKGLKTSDKDKMTNPVIHDFVVLIFVYNDILNYPTNRKLREVGMSQVKNLFENIMPRHKDYFIKNDVLCENYRFICMIIKYIGNLRNGRVI